MTTKPWTPEAYLEARDKLQASGLYDPSTESDACGVGLIVDIKGKPRREIVTLAIEALKSVWHRGAVDADGKTGDGAGLRVGVPQEFFKSAVARTGHEPEFGDIIVGMLFLPRTDFSAREKARAIVEAEVLREGFQFYGWRQPPVDLSVLGEKARLTRPEIVQILLREPGDRTPAMVRQSQRLRRSVI
ncbi:MAG: hypothetical protein JKY94_04980 [Rhodobacteraceae bacterium]|nr:hypothetical protein [Paracoccaceae bacterium]